MKNITILWWFGFWNIWDDIILFNEIKLIKEKFPNSIITVFSWNPSFIKSKFSVNSLYLPPIMWYRFYKFLNIIYLIKIFKVIKNTDLFILWGGWFFSDRQFFAISWWLRYCLLAKYFWAKVIWFWMWIGPIFYNRNKKVINMYSKIFEYISVRDKKSFNILKWCWFDEKKIIKVIDPAFFTNFKKENKDNTIWFIVKSNENFIINQIKDILIKTNYNIKFIITDSLDLNLNIKIINQIWSNRCKLISHKNIDLIIKEIWKCDFIVSQRLHGSIISFTQKVPFLNMYYHHKWKEMINYLWIDKFSVDINKLNNLQILDFINWKHNFIFTKLDLLDFKNKFLWKIK